MDKTEKASVRTGTVLEIVNQYHPQPMRLSDVVLPDSLRDLTEAIAENAHDCWAKARMDQGWTYGPERNDLLKQHPDLVPYAYLTEEEKEYDRLTALNSIKLVIKLGYSINKTK